jgi:hypothetical protein
MWSRPFRGSFQALLIVAALLTVIHFPVGLASEGGQRSAQQSQEPPTFRAKTDLLTIDAVVTAATGDMSPTCVVPIAGLLSLGHDVPPGSYTLQVNIGAGKKCRASQWADLEVRR